MEKTNFEFICKFCFQKFYSKQSRERKFCCIEHFRIWSKGKINKNPISEDKKKKISEFQKTRVRKPNSISHNKKISQARKGIKFSKNHKRNLSISKANKYINNEQNPFFGKQEKYFSLKTKEYNHSHSSYELEVMKKLDADDNVKYWTKNHKIKIEYILENHHRNYIPDFLVIYQNETKEIIEVKGYIYDKKMFEAKNNACLTFCEKNSMKYSILFKENIYGQRN